MIHAKANPGNDFRVRDVIGDVDTATNLMFRIATRIADNRTVAGLHFPSDSMAGALCGIAMGEALINHLLGRKETSVQSFAPTVASSVDFTLSNVIATLAPDTVAMNGAADPLLLEIWERALAEISDTA